MFIFSLTRNIRTYSDKVLFVATLPKELQAASPCDKDTFALLQAIKEGADLRGGYVCGVVLKGLDLSGANFEGLSLTGAHFEGANLTGANFKNADITAAKFTGANLSGADFTSVEFLGTKQVLSHARFIGANLSGATITTRNLNLFKRLGADFSSVLEYSAAKEDGTLNEPDLKPLKARRRGPRGKRCLPKKRA